MAKKTEKSHGGSLNHWIGGIMNITVKTCYDLQYLTMRPSACMNAQTEPDFIAPKHGMEHLIQHPYEPIRYSGNKTTNVIKFPSYVTSKQEIQKSTKTMNITTSFTHILMQIMS